MVSPRHLALGIFMLNRLSAFTLPLLMLFSCALMPQSQSQPPTTQRTASEQNEAAKSEQQLRELLRSNPEAFARNNYDYLLARLLEGRGAEAAQYFQQVAQRNSPLAGYALWHLAELARTAG